MKQNREDCARCICLIYAAVNENCDGCTIDCLSQMHHTCLPTDEHEAWVLYFEYVKRDLNLKKIVNLFQKKVEDKLDCQLNQLNETWLKYSLYLSTVDFKAPYLVYKDFERRHINIIYYVIIFVI